jgi:hypothetical protein
MKKKSMFLIIAVMITSILLVYSCKREEELASVQESASEAISKMKSSAEDDWLASQFQRSDSTANPDILNYKGAVILNNHCNCTYTVTDIQYTLPPGKTDVDFELFSSASCDPGNPISCNYFSGFGFSGPVCGSCAVAGCCDLWPSLQAPPGPYQFKCTVPKYSTFPVTGGGIWVDNACQGGDLKNWRITYKITCSSATKGETCTYTTLPITYAASAPINSRTHQIKLDGCGCQPTITEEPACDLLQCGGYFSGQHAAGAGFYTYPLQTLYLCPNTNINVTGIPYGVPNRYTLRRDGAIIDSKWVGDAVNYPNPYYGTNLPTAYNFNFNTGTGHVFTLQVESIIPQNTSDNWDATVTCN